MIPQLKSVIHSKVTKSMVHMYIDSFKCYIAFSYVTFYQTYFGEPIEFSLKKYDTTSYKVGNFM